MADTPDQSQRTEDPTPKRLREARRKGDAPRSQEITTLAMLCGAMLALWLVSGIMVRTVMKVALPFIDHPHVFVVSGVSLQQLFGNIGLMLGAGFSAFAALMIVSAIAGNMAQAMPVFTAHRMKPELKKISPIAGVKRVFGPSGLVNFLKGVGKLIIITVIMVFALWPSRFDVVELVRADGVGAMAMTRGLILKLLGLTVLAMSIIAGLDYAWQRHSWRQRLRMTREEVRREQKEEEGDPQIKARQRQTREAQMRRRTMAAVKEASVIVMNPTHFAVALKYEAGKTDAPICTAKGRDDLALRMRDEARKLGVPVVQNPPLARALHAGARLDAEIPVEHYEAVAKIIGFIMRRAPGYSA